MQRDESLLGAIVRFCRDLRGEGLAVTPGRAVDAARSVALVNVTDAAEFRAALRANLTVSVDDYPAFERAFESFWLGADHRPGQPVATPNMTTLENQRDGPDVYALSRVPLEGFAADGEARLAGAEATAGESDILVHRDFGDVPAADLPRLRRLIQQLAPSLATMPSRRHEPSPSGGAVDIRRTVSAARRSGGEVVRLARQRAKLRRLRAVALLDVSGSMDRYSEHLLLFFHALQLQSAQVRTYVFSTRLRDVTSVLRRRRLDDVLAGLSRDVEAWSGGTSIGACLAEFNTRFARQVVSPRTVVFIASDGWERGDPERLRHEMLALHRRAYRVVWLNPLKARDGYEPLAAGMAAALPYVDHFLPAASLADLERLKRTLAILA